MDDKDEIMITDEHKSQEVVEDAGIEYTSTEDLKAIDEGLDATTFMENTVKRLTSDDWKENFYGFDDLRRFYKFANFEAHLKNYAELIVHGVENLRSSICRNSLMLVSEIFSEYKDLSKIDESGETTPYAIF